jgi:hypothetical protein
MCRRAQYLLVTGLAVLSLAIASGPEKTKTATETAALNSFTNVA